MNVRQARERRDGLLFFEDRQERCDSAAAEAYSGVPIFLGYGGGFPVAGTGRMPCRLWGFSKSFLFLRNFFCGEGVSLGLFGENRGAIFRHYAVDRAQKMPTDTGDGVAYPLRSVFRQGMMLVLKIYIPNFEGSRISKSECSFPIRQEQSRGGSLSISGKTKSTAGCYDSVENRVFLACEEIFCILAG